MSTGPAASSTNPAPASAAADEQPGEPARGEDDSTGRNGGKLRLAEQSVLQIGLDGDRDGDVVTEHLRIGGDAKIVPVERR